MTDYAREALDQIDALIKHYVRLGRREAVKRLDSALRTAEDRIERRLHQRGDKIALRNKELEHVRTANPVETWSGRTLA